MSPNRHRGLWRRGSVYQFRVRVPGDLVSVLGRERINRSLGTSSKREAVIASRTQAHEFDRYFESVRKSGHATGTTLLSDHVESEIGLTLRRAYELFLADTSKARTEKTLLAYRTVSRTIMDLLGDDVPLNSISRQQCRDLIANLSMVPRNARKRWPDHSAKEAIARGRETEVPMMSAANINGHMNKFCSMLNWATKEEFIPRNPALGLRLHDPMLPRDKRKPFAPDQLRRIFSAPLYTGCVDDEDGYATPGLNHPRRGRFWIPLIGLVSGMRMNEVAQLDADDVQTVDGHLCFVVTTASAHGVSDKRLKTRSSERIVPVHPQLLDLGFEVYVAERRTARDLKLFPELRLRHGLYSHLFSKWFSRFLLSCGAAADRTCYHSFRHNFRDACRTAQVDREIALALGGWANKSDGSSSVADNYGRGHSSAVLYEAIARLRYAEVPWEKLRR